MNEYEVSGDRVMDVLSSPVTHEPDAVRAAQTRIRCRTSLLQHARRSRVAGPAIRPPDWRRALEPAIVGGLCAVYLFEVLSRALELYRF
jgi:hypothetical protein